MQFLIVHILSSILAATCAVGLILIFDTGTYTFGFDGTLKFWFTASCVTMLFVLPFSIIFFGIPEWMKIRMPIVIYALLGGGFVVAIVGILTDGDKSLVTPTDALRVYSCLIISGVLAGTLFGCLRRNQISTGK